MRLAMRNCFQIVRKLGVQLQSADCSIPPAHQFQQLTPNSGLRLLELLGNFLPSIMKLLDGVPSHSATNAKVQLSLDFQKPPWLTGQ